MACIPSPPTTPPLITAYDAKPPPFDHSTYDRKSENPPGVAILTWGYFSQDGYMRATLYIIIIIIIHARVIFYFFSVSFALHTYTHRGLDVHVFDLCCHWLCVIFLYTNCKNLTWIVIRRNYSSRQPQEHRLSVITTPAVWAEILNHNYKSVPNF